MQNVAIDANDEPNSAWITFSRPPAMPSCPIRSDSQTTCLTLTTGVWESCMKRRGANNMNIHYDVTSLLSAVCKVTLRSSCLKLAREEGGRILIAHMRDIQEFAGSRQLDR